MSINDEDTYELKQQRSTGYLKTVLISSGLSCFITIAVISFLLRNTAFVNIYMPNTDAHQNNKNLPERRSYAKNVELVILPFAVKQGAVCLDGSPPGYYFRQGHGKGSDKWIIHFFGGAWCFDEESCLQRSKTRLGSSNFFPSHPPTLQGILSENEKINPDFYNWNLVLLCYCDGASFTGYRPDPVNVNGQYIYLRGRKILEIIIDQLLQSDFQKANRLLLSGTSAGSLGVMMHADFIRSRIPKSIDVRALVDSGYFVDVAALSGDNIINRHFRKMFDVHNSVGGVDEDCARGFAPEVRWKCLFPQHVLGFVSTPLFVLQSAYDEWQLIHIRGINCQVPEYSDNFMWKRSLFRRSTKDTSAIPNKPSPDRSWNYKHIHGIYCRPPECTRDEMAAIMQYRNVSLYALRAVMQSPTAGLFVSSCLEHSQSLYDDTWTGIFVNGFSVAEAVGNWMFDRTNQHQHIDCELPCNPSCANVWWYFLSSRLALNKVHTSYSLCAKQREWRGEEKRKVKKRREGLWRGHTRYHPIITPLLLLLQLWIVLHTGGRGGTQGKLGERCFAGAFKWTSSWKPRRMRNVLAMLRSW